MRFTRKLINILIVLSCITFLVLATGSAAPDTVSAAEVVHFAVISDYGVAGTYERDVANLVKSWSPHFILTAGDNNCPTGSSGTIDANIGQYYQSYIYPYYGSYGAGSDINRLFPALGNHDWGNAYPNPRGADPYLAYFTLPGNERYYDFTWGPVQFFALDSDPNEPDGNTQGSAQAAWLQGRLAASTAIWKVVYFHHAPYSSGSAHGSTSWMQWPFKEWGASAVFSGHDHDYERLLVNGLPYFVVGLGGQGIRSFGTPVPGSLVRYNSDYGAMLVTADAASMRFQFYSRAGVLVDDYTILSGNAAPVATDDYVTVREGTTVTFNVLANDSDPDGDLLSVIGNTLPTHGILTNVGSGVFSYTPASRYRGTDSYTYTISDGHGNTDTALVVITVKRSGKK